MNERYFRWFLDSYNNYDFIGQLAKDVKKQIELFIDESDPDSEYLDLVKLRKIYSSFLALYSANIIGGIKKDGIYPKKGNYYLIFNYGSFLVPKAFLEFYQRIPEREIYAIIRDEKKDKEMNLDSFLGQKEYLTDKIDRVIRESGSHSQELYTVKENMIIFSILAFVCLFLGTIFLFREMTSFFKLKYYECITISLSLFVTCFFYLLILNGYYSDGRILKRGKAISLHLFDIESHIKRNINFIREIDEKKLMVAIRDGKKIKKQLKEGDFNAMFGDIDLRIEDLEHNKEKKTKVKKLYYQISAVSMTFAFGFMVSSVYISLGTSYKNLYFAVLPVTALLSVGIFYITNRFLGKTKVKTLAINFLMAVVLSLGFWVLINSIF